MAFRIAPIEAEPLRQREAPRRNAKHLDAIRALPCLACGRPPRSEAAHLRAGSRAHDKKPTGFGVTPDDCWTLPLCPMCHRMGTNAQHQMNELAFWKAHDVDPFAMAIALDEAEAHEERLAIVIGNLLSRGVIDCRKAMDLRNV